METIFLPETPKEQKRDDLKLIEVTSKGVIENKSPSIEETNLLLKIQNAEKEIFEEYMDYVESENQFLLNDCLKGTPIRKISDKERLLTQSNKLLITPKKYFGEDILNTVPKNLGRFINSVDRTPLDKKSNMKLINTPQKRKMRCSMIKTKPSICNYQDKFCQQEFPYEHVSVKLVEKSPKKWSINIFDIIYDFLIYQLPLALILYSFALYLINCL